MRLVDRLERLENRRNSSTTLARALHRYHELGDAALAELAPGYAAHVVKLHDDLTEAAARMRETVPSEPCAPSEDPGDGWGGP